MLGLPLQSINSTPPAEARCYLENPQGWLDCALNQQSSAVGGDPVWGLVAGGMLLLAFYVASGRRLDVPAVVMTLLGGFLVPALPASYQNIALVIAFMGLVTAAFAALRKYVMNPGV